MNCRKLFRFVKLHQVFAKSAVHFFIFFSPFTFSTRPFPIETSIHFSRSTAYCSSTALYFEIFVVENPLIYISWLSIPSVHQVPFSLVFLISKFAKLSFAIICPETAAAFREWFQFTAFLPKTKAQVGEKSYCCKQLSYAAKLLASSYYIP